MWHIPPFYLLITSAGLLAAVALVTVRLLSTQVAERRIICPVDGKPRQVVATGSCLDGEHWEDLHECTEPGGRQLVGKEITCSKACLLSPK